MFGCSGNDACLEGLLSEENGNVPQCNSAPTQSSKAVHRLLALIEEMSQDVLLTAVDLQSYETAEELSVADAEEAVCAGMAELETCHDAAVTLKQEVMEHLRRITPVIPVAGSSQCVQPHDC